MDILDQPGTCVEKVPEDWNLCCHVYRHLENIWSVLCRLHAVHHCFRSWFPHAALSSGTVSRGLPVTWGNFGQLGNFGHISASLISYFS